MREQARLRMCSACCAAGDSGGRSDAGLGRAAFTMTLPGALGVLGASESVTPCVHAKGIRYIEMQGLLGLQRAHPLAVQLVQELCKWGGCMPAHDPQYSP